MKMKTKILVSACLLGEAVRYDGRSKPSENVRFQTWVKENRVISICPEVLGGLSVPREKAEKKADRIISETGTDVTEAFEKGAQIVTNMAKKENIKIAILKEKSPSCGSKQVYDGHFDGTLIVGKGLTTIALESLGIRVFGESQIDAAAAFLDKLDDDLNLS